jgi:hypothetical protein
MAINQSVAQPFDFTQERIETKQRGLWGQALRRLMRNRLAMASGILLFIVATVAVLADSVGAVQRHDPAAQTTPSRRSSRDRRARTG